MNIGDMWNTNKKGDETRMKLVLDKKNIYKLISGLLVIQPILVMYSIPGLFGTFSDYVMILVFEVLFLEYLLHKKFKMDEIEFIGLMFIVYIFLNFMVNVNFSTETSKELIYMLRTCIYYSVSVVFVKEYFDINIAYKTYKYVSIFATCWLILQYISMNFWHLYIPGSIEMFVKRTDLLNQRDYLNYVQFYRPCSIFAEPAHYATFVVGFLGINIVLDCKNSGRTFVNLFLTFGIMLSGSTTGIAICLFAWGYYAWEKFKGRKVTLKMLFLVIGAMLSLIVLLNTNSFNILITRTFKSNSAASGRFSNVTSIFEGDNFFSMLMGYGSYYTKITDEYGWLPGYPLIYKCYGVIGIVFVVSLFLMICKKRKRESRVLLIIFAVLNLGTEVITTAFLLLFIPFMVKGVEKIETTISECNSAYL